MKRLVVAKALLATLLVGACSGSPDVIEPAPREPSSGSTPPEDLEPPVQPSVANEKTESGAATFADFWLRTSDYASWTGDLEQLRAISTQDCAGCSEYLDYYSAIYGAGGKIVGGEQRISEVTTQVSRTGGQVLVRARLNVKPGEVRRSKGANFETTAADESRVVFRVAWKSDRWQMNEVALDE